MRKTFRDCSIGIIIGIVLYLIIALSISGCHGAGYNYVVKYYGGETTVELQPGQKLEEITWKEDSLWILSRPMRDDETPETHMFYEDSQWGVFEGVVTVIEKEEQ
jgi:hypothetical protein